MSEWPNEHAWKACVPQGTEGSNPSLSTIQPHINRLNTEHIYRLRVLINFKLQNNELNSRIYLFSAFFVLSGFLCIASRQSSFLLHSIDKLLSAKVSCSLATAAVYVISYVNSVYCYVTCCKLSRLLHLLKLTGFLAAVDLVHG